MCFLKGFVLACVLHLSLSQIPTQNSPLLDPATSNSNSGAQGLVIPNNFQTFGTGDTGTDIWTRRQGPPEANAAQTGSPDQTNQAAGGMVVHPFQNVQGFGGGDPVSSNNQNTMQHGGGTPVQFPSDPTGLASQPNTNIGTDQNTMINSNAQTTTGLQVPFSNNNAQTATGLQVPFSNNNAQTATGLQVSFSNNKAQTATGLQVPFSSFNSNTNIGDAGPSPTAGSQAPFNAFSMKTDLPQNNNVNTGSEGQTSSNIGQNTGTATGIQIPMSTFDANTEKPLNTNVESTGSVSTTGQQGPFNTFSANPNNMLNKNVGNSGSTGIQIPMGTMNTNTDTLLNQNTVNTGSTSGIQIPMNTFNENTNSLLNKNNQNAGGGVQIPFSSFNANTDAKSLVNDNSLNTVPGSTTNFFNANMKGLPNENILKPGSVKAVSNQLPNKNSLLTTVNVPNTNNVLMQNNPQEFTQIGQTAFDNNLNRAFNPNLNSALGFGNNNNNNIPSNLPHGTPCVDSRIKPAYIKTRTGNMVFDPTHFKLGSSKLRCASGTGFSLETCACEFIADSTLAAFYASIGAADWATRCNEDFSIDFNRGIYDTSFDQWYVDVHGVNTSHGVGVFTGIANSSVALPRYRGYDLKTIAFEFRFRSNVTNREHPHPLFTNCEGHSGHYKTHNEEPTYGVILNSNRPKMTFFVTYEKARPKQAFGDPLLHTQYISMDVNPLVWNTVRFSYDGNFLTAYLNGQKESKPAKGVIADRMEHQIVIGHCLRYGQFVGEIDDVKVYTQCIPSRF